MLVANRGFHNLVDDMFNDPFFTRSYNDTNTQVMRTDIHEKDGNYLLEMELPGFAKEDIQADLDDGYLTVSAHKENSQEEKDSKGNCIHKERFTGTCKRSFYVGDKLTQDDIKAAFNDGVLSLTFPKEPDVIEEQPKTIAIE